MVRISAFTLLFVIGSAGLAAELADWKPQPASWKGAVVKAGSAVLTANAAGKGGWSYLLSPDDLEHVELAATITVRTPAKQFRFFGQGWSVWPDKLFADQGWEACLILRAGEKSGYRVQVSHKLQELAVVKFPDGGYVRSVPCPVKLNEPLALSARVRGSRITILANGKELTTFVDGDRPLPAGKLGLGVSSSAAVQFSKVVVNALPAAGAEKLSAHVPNFAARKWLGGRLWVFDGAEPIMLLPDPASTTINNVKLRPGVKPLLSFNSHWDVQNQGAFPEAKNDTTDVKVTGGGKELAVAWVGKHVKDIFGTKTAMTVGFDPARQVYTYDIDSELEMKGNAPFHFRYGFDFEHHTPLDPFNWQYLLFRTRDGKLNRRPVYPIDPGPQNDLEASSGLRVWQGRHNDPVPVCPAVEYSIGGGKRKLNTAVCAAFYDTGVSFEPETLPAGGKVHVRYRYTGYPADEAARLFKQAVVYDSPTLDPNQHWIFAEWPKTTFSQFVPLSDTWIYGRSPFKTAHNTRPTYELVKNTGHGNGFAMKLGPLAYGQAALPMKEPLPAGRYALSVKAKGENLHGPGGRIEIAAVDKSGKEIIKQTHFVGAGTFAWKEAGFEFNLPAEAKSFALGFGNGGTGDFFVTNAEVILLKEGPRPTGVAAAANPIPAKRPPAPVGAIADYRMIEGRGLHALDFAGGPFGPLELANLTWTIDEGKPALRFADNSAGAKIYPKAGKLDQGYLRHPSYAKYDTLPVALAGHHGGGFKLPAFSLVAWIKPGAAMGQTSHGGKGDVLGVGARRIILRLVGQKAPYKLQAALNVNDVFTAETTRLEADKWRQVALTGEPTDDKKWKVRLFLDGQEVKEGTTKLMQSPLSIPPSAILGAEIFYFHDAYYRGLIGRTLIFNRALSAEELRNLTPKAE